jgi:hypothetical protein
MHALLAILALVLLLPHGDTLRVGGVAVRLKGIAAPEMDEPGRPSGEGVPSRTGQGRMLVCELTPECTHGRQTGARLRQIQRREVRGGAARGAS